MQLFKAYIAWCNKLSTMYIMFGWSMGMAMSHFGQSNFQKTLVDLAFASFFYLIIALAKRNAE